MTGKLIIFSAPSGSGKSTLINYLMGQDLNLAFSISATSRPPRGTERDGVEYFFLTPEEFRGYMKGTAIAYLAREQDKGGMLDIKKAGHTLQGLVELLGAE
jgi:guanylate kinase